MRCNPFLDRFCLDVLGEICLELSWGNVAQGGVFSLGVVVGVEVGEELDLRVEKVIKRSQMVKHVAREQIGSAKPPPPPGSAERAAART